jgi:hypothetical protein
MVAHSYSLRSRLSEAAVIKLSGVCKVAQLTTAGSVCLLRQLKLPRTLAAASAMIGGSHLRLQRSASPAELGNEGDESSILPLSTVAFIPRRVAPDACSAYIPFCIFMFVLRAVVSSAERILSLYPCGTTDFLPAVVRCLASTDFRPQQQERRHVHAVSVVPNGGLGLPRASTAQLPSAPHMNLSAGDGGAASGSLLSSEDLSCPICVETIEDAFVTPCGHTFCFKCISTHLKNKSTCPSCAAHLVQDQVHPNFLLNKVSCCTCVAYVHLKT